MQLLDKILELNIGLVDYECIGDKVERLVAFGRYAGIAGVVDFFRGIGEFLLTGKYHNPFLYVGSSYMYPNLDEIKVCLSNLGNVITTKGLPKAFAPYVFAVTSKGGVAQGALETLQILPHEIITPEQLDTLPQDDNGKIYILILEAKDLV